MKHTLLLLCAAASALTACTQDELSNGTLPEGEYPLIINATGLQAVATPTATRATVDGDWQGVTTVALSVGGTVKEYNVTASDADGYKTATLSSNTDPFWWTSRDPITVSAWWPYATTMPDVVVKSDQRTQADFAASDFFISAENQTVQFDNPTLTFSHRTARITVNLEEGNGITSVMGADVYVTGLSTDGGNPASISTYTSGNDTYEALAAPQTVKANTPFIAVDLNGGTFYFRPQSDVVLEANSRYTYTVRVTAKGLELVGCTITGWTEGGGESGTAEDLGFTYNANTHTYSVYTPDGLTEWAEAAQSDPSLNCTLAEDINMAGKEWTPIGNSFQTYNGTFDGQGYSITGLNAPSLFGGTGESATVKNLQLVDVELYESGGGTAGIVVNNYGQVIACSVTGKIDAFSAVSGIAYANQGSITACWFDGTLKENASGGIVNYNFSIGSITACYWRAKTDKGVYNNQGGTVDATKVNDGESWLTAVDGMNKALTDNDYKWELSADGLPELKRK
ncbi:MAG TPA: fimbrillin family protein [Candidatus Bacteroides merdigallinarum]|uniref:Fimbrillin family protein n=1 Tax=Candidatus Bacteroides merdigallinarum TaxID=2838473 RepID=A0A9D2EAM9_9BACE|nr:fimbrillin family protein [Candidatus Bacteroides merdigallinarum]